MVRTYKAIFFQICIASYNQMFRMVLNFCRGQKFHLSAHNYKWNLERRSNSSKKHSSCRTSALRRITPGSHIAYYSLMFFTAYAFKGQVHVFAGHVQHWNIFVPRFDTVYMIQTSRMEVYIAGLIRPYALVTQQPCTDQSEWNMHSLHTPQQCSR